MRTRRQALAAKPEAAREMPDETAAGKRKPKANSYMLKRLTDSREDENLEDEMHAAMQENDVLADGGDNRESDDSDDEAPEEVSLATGRMEQEVREAQERAAAVNARTRKRKNGAVESPSEPAEEEDQKDDLPDMLPDNVLERLGDARSEPAVSKDTKEAIDDMAASTKPKQKRQKKKRKGTLVLDKGPIQVQVLGTGDNEPRSSESAANFFMERFYGGARKRSHTMLKPVSALRRVGPAAKFV